MEALNFLKFWRPTTALPAEIRTEEEEEGDSLFDLELSATEPSNSKQKHTNPVQYDIFSKRKINPNPNRMEQPPSSKPRSPIALLKSAPGFRVLSKSHKTEESKRFSKEAIQRYLRLIKLLQAKSSNKTPTNDKQGNSHFKNLGKIKSSPARRDDSLLQHHDGIQSAILHCKRSFDSSREASTLSRSSSDSPIKISTSDCPVLPTRMSIEGDCISGM